MSVKIKKEIQKIENDIIVYRRNLHQYPELSFKEFKKNLVILSVLVLGLGVFGIYLSL